MAQRPLTPRDIETLRDLRSTNDDRMKHLGADHEFCKPMDIGARDSSHHSATLKKLVRRGLVDIANQSVRHPDRSRWPRSGCKYRINIAGRALLDQQEAAKR